MEKVALFMPAKTVPKKNMPKTEGLSSGCIKQLLSFIAVCLCCTTLFAQDENFIEWNDSVKLEWADFKAKPKQHSRFLAETDWSIKYSCNLENGNLVFVVNCFFNPALSWVKTEGKTSYLLAHEQAHFDIAEIFTRKLRKEVSETNYTKNTIQSLVQKMYAKAFNDCRKMQEQYDEDTHHSIKKMEQDLWEKKIDSMLKELEAYEGSIYKVPFPG